MLTLFLLLLFTGNCIRCHSAPLRDLDFLFPAEKLSLLTFGEMYPEAQQELVEGFLTSQVFQMIILNHSINIITHFNFQEHLLRELPDLYSYGLLPDRMRYRPAKRHSWGTKSRAVIPYPRIGKRGIKYIDQGLAL
jgi:hypothetical protein